MTYAVHGNGGTLAAMSTARFAEEDARRMAELDELIKLDRCRYCGCSVQGSRTTPPSGVCSRKACKAKAAREEIARGRANRTETARHSEGVTTG